MFETMNRYPMLDAAVKGLLAGLATKAATKYGYKGLQNLSKGRLPDLKGSKKAQLGNLLSVLAGLGTSAYTLYTKGDTASKGNFLKSITDPDYWKTNPMADIQAQKPSYGWYKPPTDLEKENSDFNRKNIPINFSMNLIQNDPYLDLPQKTVTKSIIYNAENKSVGHTSKGNLLASATRAGLGFGSAYALSSGLGSVLSLQPAAAKQLSMMGGVAGAIANVI